MDIILLSILAVFFVYHLLILRKDSRELHKAYQLVTELTNKLMSKNYADYALTKSYETPSETEIRPRTDTDEALIEIANQKIEETVKLAGDIDAGFKVTT